uniref:Uncharacterized protein n=1 Tax=Panagrolaimus sp. ES5 TaxID=591445 RepID=A0AC34F1C7_9BILA
MLPTTLPTYKTFFKNNQTLFSNELNQVNESSDNYVTFGSVLNDIQHQSAGKDEAENGVKKVGTTIFNDEESMSIALAKAQILIDEEEEEEDASTTFEASTTIDEETRLILAQKQSLLYQKYYLGPISDAKAKAACFTRSAWLLYHRVEKSLSDAAASLSDFFQLPSSLLLYIVYRRNDNGQHELYPIRSKTFPSSRATIFWADYGDPEAPKFDSIYGLIHFYDNFGHINVNAFDSHRYFITEVFPLWKRPARVPTISEYSALSSDISWIPADSVFDAPTISDSATTVHSFSSRSSEDEINVDF